MILHSVILEAIGAYLVPALSRAHLLAPILGLGLIMFSVHMFAHPLCQHAASFGQAVFAAATLGRGLDACGPVAYATAILMLVAMLAASAGA